MVDLYLDLVVVYLPEPPLRLPRGGSALERAADILARRSAEDQGWSDLSRRTEFTLPARAR